MVRAFGAVTIVFGPADEISCAGCHTEMYSDI